MSALIIVAFMLIVGFGTANASVDEDAQNIIDDYCVDDTTYWKRR